MGYRGPVGMEAFAQGDDEAAFGAVPGHADARQSSSPQSGYPLTNDQQVAPLERSRECAQCPEMIVLPTGAFSFGSKPGDSRNRFYFMFYEKGAEFLHGPDDPVILPIEIPRHRVQIDIPFAMGRNEVTFGEWMACVEAGACTHVPKAEIYTRMPNGRLGDAPLGPEHPVVHVSYLDMLDYVAWINSMVGADVYWLPTEAEWEYAARAGTTTRFAQGEELTADQANFSRTGTERNRDKEMPHLVSRNMPVQVGELDAANGWGLRHMAGNVEELNMSCWSRTHLGLGTSSEYLARDLLNGTCRRTLKGGSYSGAMEFSRPGKRGNTAIDRRAKNNGFRLVREFRQGK